MPIINKISLDKVTHDNKKKNYLKEQQILERYIRNDQ